MSENGYGYVDIGEIDDAEVDDYIYYANVDNGEVDYSLVDDASTEEQVLSDIETFDYSQHGLYILRNKYIKEKVQMENQLLMLELLGLLITEDDE